MSDTEERVLLKRCPGCGSRSLIREGRSVVCLLCAWRGPRRSAPVKRSLHYLTPEPTLADAIIRACRLNLDCRRCWRRSRCEELYGLSDGRELAHLLSGKDLARTDRALRRWKQWEEKEDERCRVVG